MRQIPLKNYFILFLILSISCACALYIMFVFKNSSEQNTISKLNINELKLYIKDNPSTIICFVNSEFNHSAFKKSFDKFISKYALEKQTLYINNETYSYRDFKELVNNNSLELSNYIIITNNGNISSIIPISKNDINMDKLEKKLIEIEVLS